MIYDAFISYRHVEKDKIVAHKLQELLEKYTVSDSGKKRHLHVFVDDSELPSSDDLGKDIENALENSQFLIIVYSETTRNSKWCLEELKHFKAIHGNTNKHILPLIIDKEPKDVFPDELIYVSKDGNNGKELVEVEPLCADIRANSLKESLKKLKDKEHMRIVAPILGLMFDDLYKRQERKKQELLIEVFSAVMAVVLCFGIYNFYVNQQLTAQNREILKNESVALAFKSNVLLKNGDRIGAINTAISALPDENNDRPYVASAQKSLADALYVYQDKQYRSAYQINQKTDIADYDISSDGSIVITLDDYGSLNVYKNGNMLWSAKLDEMYLYADSDDYVKVMYDESSSCVVVIRQWYDILCYKGETGELNWTLSVADDLNTGNVEMADISSKSSTLAICGENYIDQIGIRKIIFIDISTGQIISETEERKESSLVDDACFIKDGEEFLYAALDPFANIYTIYRIDVKTGEILQDPTVQNDSFEYYNLVRVSYVPPVNDENGGIFIYICEFNSAQNGGNAHIGFIEEDAKEWSYYESFDSLSSSYDSAPEIYIREDGRIILSGPYCAVKLSRSGIEQSRVTYDREVIYQYQDSDSQIRLFFEDGTTRKLDFYGYKSISLSEYGGYTFSSNAAMNAKGSYVKDQAFALVLEDEDHTINVFEVLGEDNYTPFDEPLMEDDYLGGEILELPDQSGFIYLEDSSVDVPEGNDQSYWYAYSGTKYDLDGNIIDQFSFDGPFMTTNFSCFSSDGIQMYFDHYDEYFIYDFKEHALKTITEDLKLRTASNLVGDDVITAGLSDSLVYWTNGNDRETVSYPQEKSYLDFENLTVSENGVIIMSFYDSDCGLCIWNYNIQSQKWHTICLNEITDGDHILAGGKNTDAVALVTDSNSFIMWKDVSNENDYCQADTLNAENINNIQFILQDQYLLAVEVKNSNIASGIWLNIIDARTGESVYEYCPDGGASYTDIFVKEDSENAKLFIYSSNGSMPGLCIDTDTWETIYEIPYLRGVFNDVYVSADLNEIKKGKIYSMEELISMGKQLSNKKVSE